MKKAVQRKVRKASDRFYGYRDQVLTFQDAEDLHQMRVAGRTLLSFLYLLPDKEEAKSQRFLKVRRPLKKAMGPLGALRDLDVMLEEIEDRLPSFPPGQRALVEKWLEHKRGEREGLRAELAEMLPSLIDGRWKGRIDSWIDERVPALAKKSPMVRKVRGLRNEKTLAIIAIGHFQATDIADEGFLDQLHKARISVKKLRYALEALKKFVDVDAGEIDSLKALQDGLGHIQDLRVWTRDIEACYGNCDVVSEIASAWRDEMLRTLQGAGIGIGGE